MPSSAGSLDATDLAIAPASAMSHDARRSGTLGATNGRSGRRHSVWAGVLRSRRETARLRRGDIGWLSTLCHGLLVHPAERLRRFCLDADQRWPSDVDLAVARLLSRPDDGGTAQADGRKRVALWL